MAGTSNAGRSRAELRSPDHDTEPLMGAEVPEDNESGTDVTGWATTARESAWRSLRLLLPVVALYTIVSLTWSTPLAGLLQRAETPAAFDADSSVKRRTPKAQDDPLSADKGAGASFGKDSDVFRPTSRRRQMYNLPAPACMRATSRARSFLVICPSHSAAPAFLEEVRAHPDLRVDPSHPLDRLNNSENVQYNASAALSYTRRFFDNAIGADKIPGFAIQPRYILDDPDAWASLAKEYDTRIVWHYRRNALKQAVGIYHSPKLDDMSAHQQQQQQNLLIQHREGQESVERSSGQWSANRQYVGRCGRDGEGGEECRVTIDDFDAFQRTLTNVLRSDFSVAEAAHRIVDGGDCVHELRYEDYVFHRRGTIDDLLDFLSISHIDSTPNESFTFSRDDNLCRVVQNFNAFCAEFYGCKVWRYLFEDERNACICPFSSSPMPRCSITP